MNAGESTYNQLLKFIRCKMRLSHVYQPVMLMTLLRNQGTATVDQIAKQFLVQDDSQIDYYARITKRMPAKVLSNHGIVRRDREQCFLNGFDTLSREQVTTLIEACQIRLDNYRKKRGQAIFQHRRQSNGGTVREAGKSYQWHESDCLFCKIPEDHVLTENELAHAVLDGFPVTELHTLIIPKRHTPSYFELILPEWNSCNLLLEQMKKDIQQQDSSVTGFNIGINDGIDSGQTIFHCHIHLIPRRKGDAENPSGGVRRVLPEKQHY